MKTSRIKEFEALRGLSIILLLLLHSGAFLLPVFGHDIEILSYYNGAFLLGSFFFLAGYFFDKSFQKRSTDLFGFWKDKLLRLFPPYWVSLFLFTLVYSLKKRDLFIYILNLQILFTPNHIKQLLTVWYISLLFVYFIVFGFLLWGIKSNSVLLISSIFIFSGGYIVNLRTDLIDQRFFLYFFIFLAGIYFYRYENIRTRIFQAPTILIILFAVFGVFLFWTVHHPPMETRNLQFIAFVNIFILGFILLFLSVFRTKIGDWKVWAFLSYASYFTYLFHRPIWYFLQWALGPNILGRDIYLYLFPGSIIALIAGYFLQKGYDKLLNFFVIK